MRKATEQALTAIEADQGLLARLCDCNRTSSNLRVSSEAGAPDGS